MKPGSDSSATPKRDCPAPVPTSALLPQLCRSGGKFCGSQGGRESFSVSGFTTWKVVDRKRLPTPSTTPKRADLTGENFFENRPLAPRRTRARPETPKPRKNRGLTRGCLPRMLSVLAGGIRRNLARRNALSGVFQVLLTSGEHTLNWHLHTCILWFRGYRLQYIGVCTDFSTPHQGGIP